MVAVGAKNGGAGVGVSKKVHDRKSWLVLGERVGLKPRETLKSLASPLKAAPITSPIRTRMGRSGCAL